MRLHARAIATAPTSRMALERRLSVVRLVFVSSADAICTAPSGPTRLPPRWSSASVRLPPSALPRAVAPASAISLKRALRTWRVWLTWSAAASPIAPWHLMSFRCRSSARSDVWPASASAMTPAPLLPMRFERSSRVWSALERTAGSSAATPSSPIAHSTRLSRETEPPDASAITSELSAAVDSCSSASSTSLKEWPARSASATQLTAMSLCERGTRGAWGRGQGVHRAGDAQASRDGRGLACEEGVRAANVAAVQRMPNACQSTHQCHAREREGCIRRLVAECGGDLLARPLRRRLARRQVRINERHPCRLCDRESAHREGRKWTTHRSLSL